MHTQQDGLSTGRIFARSFAAVSLLSTALLTGCANPGPPRPPSLQLPAQVSDLAAERIGNRVLLRWTTPAQTTDKLDVRGPMSAEICRGEGNLASVSKKSASTCVPVKTVPDVSGTSSTWDDLPASLLAEPVTLLTYRVEIFNTAGRSAGRSTVAAYSASGAAPPPISSLTTTASEAGVVLRWKQATDGESFAVDLLRQDLTPPPATRAHKATTVAPLPLRHTKSGQPGKAQSPDPNEVHLRASPTTPHQDGFAGTVDTTAAMGNTYSYVAQQVRLAELDGHSMEIRSEPSQAVTLAMRDTFPPKPPTGLATIPGTTDGANGAPAKAYIDLSWEPNSEADLAGYLVYRQLARPNGDPQGPLGKLTSLPIVAPAYRDVAVVPGQRYSYHVTAVDASGNESAPSARAQEVAAAQNAGSPP